jgi:Tfp pilus assembly protein PilZ
VELLRKDDRPCFLGYVENLSATGAFIQSARPRTAGSQIQMRLHLPVPGAAPIACLSEVVWTRDLGGVERRSPGMGVRFLEIEPAAIEALERLCSS